VIVETPHRNLGRDYIMIFDEAGGVPLEFPHRTPLPMPQRAPGCCARCGYFVVPLADPTEGLPRNQKVTFSWFLAVDELREKGHGYRCAALSCAECYVSGPPVPRHPDGSLDIRCLLCGEAVDPYVEDRA
jgi:hypothetical protein